MSERVHLVGIGGISMSGLAKLLLARGVTVSGSDAQASSMTADLAARGAAVTIGHRADLVEGADRVVSSDAIHEDNPELRRARELGLPVQRRSQVFGELMAERRGIAVSGTHGKTTVTAMIGLILVEAGMDPTVALGGEYAPLDGNLRIGRGDWMVLEACEAYESYLDLRPEIALVTNIEPDHLDHHKTEARLRESFAQFLGLITPDGCAVLCSDREELRALAHRVTREVVTYGLSPAARVRGDRPHSEGARGSCQLVIEGKEHGRLEVGVPGRHNIINALGATAAAWRAGAPIAACQRALAGFTGVGRRFEILGEAGGVTVVDDYAHHPTELSATIAAARAVFPGRRVVAVFQPHLYSRTRDFADGFAQALEAADLVILTDIYPAREAPIAGVTSRLIAERVRADRGKGGVREMAKEEVVSELPGLTGPGDVILVMGAGDIGETARELAGRLGVASPRSQAAAVKR